jgi:glucose/arabinose dehydrogenase
VGWWTRPSPPLPPAHKKESRARIQPFITGFLVDNKYLGRPVDMDFLKDGSMLLSDDFNRAMYRISYGPAHQAAR